MRKQLEDGGLLLSRVDPITVSPTLMIESTGSGLILGLHLYVKHLIPIHPSGGSRNGGIVIRIIQRKGMSLLNCHGGGYSVTPAARYLSDTSAPIAPLAYFGRCNFLIREANVVVGFQRARRPQDMSFLTPYESYIKLQ